jgi:hypothetical protein
MWFLDGHCRRHPTQKNGCLALSSLYLRETEESVGSSLEIPFDQPA